MNFVEREWVYRVELSDPLSVIVSTVRGLGTRLGSISRFMSVADAVDELKLVESRSSEGNGLGT